MFLLVLISLISLVVLIIDSQIGCRVLFLFSCICWYLLCVCICHQFWRKLHVVLKKTIFFCVVEIIHKYLFRFIYLVISVSSSISLFTEIPVVVSKFFISRIPCLGFIYWFYFQFQVFYYFINFILLFIYYFTDFLKGFIHFLRTTVIFIKTAIWSSSCISACCNPQGLPW